MQETVTIRPLERSDIDQLLELLEQVANERLWIATEPGFDTALYRARFERFAAAGDSGAFVAVSGGRIVGQLTVYPHEEYGHVIGMLVHEEHRRQGIGRRLLETALEWALERNLPSISLLVFPHNTRAIALYQRAGFEMRTYYRRDVPRKNGEVWDSLLMTRALR